MTILKEYAFVLLWLSETAFDMGAALMNFALGVWVFENVDSVEKFSGAMLTGVVPTLIAIPFAGAMADRFDRRRVIVCCDIVSGLSVLILAHALFSGKYIIQYFYLFNALGALIGAVRHPSYHAAVAVVVPKDKLSQANGLIGVTQGALQIMAPAAAGFLMASSGLKGIMVVEIVSMISGALMIFAALSHSTYAIHGMSNKRSFPIFKAIRQSFKGVADYFRSYPLMFGLGIYTLIQQGMLFLALTMLTPLVLSTHPSSALGMVLTFGALGGLLGSALLAVTNINKNLMLCVLISDIGMAVFIMLAGFAGTPVFWDTCALLAFGFAGLSSGCGGALWMRKVPRKNQGSVFASISAGNLVVICIFMLSSSWMVEQVFEPFLMNGGAWAGTIGTWIGTGKGRGIGFLFILVGLAFTLISLFAILHPTLRRLDEIVPDQVELL